MRKQFDEALAAWRAAEERLRNGVVEDRPALRDEAERERSEFQRLSRDDMVERMDDLKDAEARRQQEVPSTPPYHAAAREEKAIAAGIFEAARANDEDTPSRRSN